MHHVLHAKYYDGPTSYFVDYLGTARQTMPVRPKMGPNKESEITKDVIFYKMSYIHLSNTKRNQVDNMPNDSDEITVMFEIRRV